MLIANAGRETTPGVFLSPARPDSGRARPKLFTTANSQKRHPTATESPQARFNPSAMDIDALHSTLLTVTLVSEKLSSIARDLPGKNGTANIKRALIDAENDLRVAKATLAGELGFHVCPRCWPPELLTVDRQGAETCPACGQRVCDRAA